MKIAFLYGGQGSQVRAMGKELYSNYPEIRDFYDSIELDFPLKKYSFKGELDLISQTEFTQPIIHNLHGEYIENVDIREALYKQVNNKVLFKKSLEELINSDVDLYIEIGNDSVIKGFMKRLDRKIKVHEVNFVESIEALLKEVENYGKQ